MLRFIIAIFIVLHGLVHLLYFGQGLRFFELRPGMTWPDGSWAFSRLLSDKTVRLLAGVASLLIVIGFAAAGTGLLMKEGWWRPVAAGSAAFSTAIFILFWDGKKQKMDDQGGYGILINLAILALLLFNRPDFRF